MSTDKQVPLLEAASRADWMQVVLNGGPPCFHLEEYGTFCLRAERWDGHGDFHEFVSLHDLLATERLAHAKTQEQLAQAQADTERLNAVIEVLQLSGVDGLFDQLWKTQYAWDRLAIDAALRAKQEPPQTLEQEQI